MRRKKLRRYAGVFTMLLILAAFVPSALSPAEGTSSSEAAAGAIARTASIGAIGPTGGGMTTTEIGVGTIAMATAITEAAVIAVAASQTNSSNSTTIH